MKHYLLALAPYSFTTTVMDARFSKLGIKKAVSLFQDVLLFLKMRQIKYLIVREKLLHYPVRHDYFVIQLMEWIILKSTSPYSAEMAFCNFSYVRESVELSRRFVDDFSAIKESVSLL